MNIIKRLTKPLLTVTTRTIYIYSLVTGVITGLVAVLFFKVIHFIMDHAFVGLAKMPILSPGDSVTLFEKTQAAPNKIIFFCIPIIGGLLAGLITYFFARETAGGGTETFLDSFHNKAGILRKRTGLVKFITSSITLGSGGSGGKEGPMMLIGASFGSIIGRFIKMGARARRTLLLAGTAGGLGAIFRTPLGGAITAVEVLYKEDFESDALIPCIISSVTAYTTFGIFMGFGHVLNFSTKAFQSPTVLIFYAILALICTATAYVFVNTYHYLGESFFNKLPVPKYLLPACGGLLIACVGLFVPEVIGGGLGVIQQAIYGTYSADWAIACKFFLLLALLKIFTTGFTIQSGGSAGLLIPSFFIGAMLGGFTGTIFHHFFPELVPFVTPFIVVGMASFFAASTNASLGALVMVTELTGGYELLPALMVVAVISLIFSHKWSVYKNQAANKFYSKAHLWDMNPAILKNIQISTAFNIFHDHAIIDNKMPLAQIRILARKFHDAEFFVKDENQNLLGILTLHDLEFDEDEDISGLNELLVAEDMLRGEASFITPQDSLFKAITYLANTDFEIIPVVDETPSQTKLLGYLTRKDILQFYNRLGNKS